MPIPTTPIQLLVTLVLVVPGFVFRATRIWLRGRTPSDLDTASSVLHAIAMSTVFSLAYIVVAGSRLVDAVEGRGDALQYPRASGAVCLIAAFIVPMVVAAVPSIPRRREQWTDGTVLHPSQWTNYDPTPSAWDAAFLKAVPGYVRVRMNDGSWFAGYFGENSYASSFPDPRSLFVELEFSVSDDGVIGDVVDGSSGAVIDCTDAVLVELLKPRRDSVKGGSHA